MVSERQATIPASPLIIARPTPAPLPPSEARWLANHRYVFSAVHDIESPEHLARFPQANAARRLIVDLGPGDLLYIAVGWWHQVRSLTLTYTNFPWPNDGYQGFPGD